MVRHFFFKDVLYIILNSLVFSKLFYCSTAWYETSKENIHKLQLMQNFVGCVLTNTKKFDHITPVIHELGRLTIEELLRLRNVTMIFKCLNGLVPSYWVTTKLVKLSDTKTRIALDRAINLTSLSADLCRAACLPLQGF